MPILNAEPDILPDDLLEESFLSSHDDQHNWFVLQTRSRSEKQLMRHLRANGIAHYGPVISKRYRSPAGRIRNSFIPLFSGYIFMFGTDDDRYKSLTTNCVVKTVPVVEAERLVRDLRQIQGVITKGVALTPEEQLGEGQRVLVKSGPFKNYEGVVIRREQKSRLLLSVEFLDKGVSMEIDECQLQAI